VVLIDFVLEVGTTTNKVNWRAWIIEDVVEYEGCWLTLVSLDCNLDRSYIIGPSFVSRGRDKDDRDR
jgi:hypothetical protein